MSESIFTEVVKLKLREVVKPLTCFLPSVDDLLALCF